MSRKFRYNDLLISVEREGEGRSGEGCRFCTRVTACRPLTALRAGRAASDGCSPCTLVTGCPTTTTMQHQGMYAHGDCGPCTLVTGCPTTTAIPQQGRYAYEDCGTCTLVTACTTTTYDPNSGTVAAADLDAYKADLERHLADVEALTAGPSSDELAELEQNLESALEEVRQQRSELQGSSSKTRKS